VVGDQVARGEQSGKVTTVVAGCPFAAPPFLYGGHAHADHPGDVAPGETEVGQLPEQVDRSFLAACRGT